MRAAALATKFSGPQGWSWDAPHAQVSTGRPRVPQALVDECNASVMLSATTPTSSFPFSGGGGKRRGGGPPKLKITGALGRTSKDGASFSACFASSLVREADLASRSSCRTSRRCRGDEGHDRRGLGSVERLARGRLCMHCSSYAETLPGSRARLESTEGARWDRARSCARAWRRRPSRRPQRQPSSIARSAGGTESHGPSA